MSYPTKSHGGAEGIKPTVSPADLNWSMETANKLQQNNFRFVV